MPEKLRETLEQFKQQLVADKKKAAVLGVLCLVLLVAVARAMFGGSTPAPVKAVPVAVPVAPAVPADPVTPRIRPIPEVIETLRSAASSVGSFARSGPRKGGSAEDWRGDDRPVEIDGLSRTLIRDPFNATDWKAFLPPEPEGGQIPLEFARKPVDKGPSFWAKLREAAASRARDRLANREEFERALSDLALQSTLTGVSPSAYISGRLVHEGIRLRDSRSYGSRIVTS